MADQWVKIVAVVPEGVAALFEDARARVIQFAPLDPKDAVQSGIVLEALVADFLAGPDQPFPHPQTEDTDA